MQACPELSPWTLWSDCSVDCGRGIRNRTRECLFGSFGDPGCEGEAMDEIDCFRGVSRSFILLVVKLKLADGI